MRVTPDMKIAEVLKINEYMIDALTSLSDSFERLRDSTRTTALSKGITVAEAARNSQVP